MSSKGWALWQSFAKKSSIQQFTGHFLSWAGVAGSGVGGMVGLEVLTINTCTCFPEGHVQLEKQLHFHRVERFLLCVFMEQLLGARVCRFRKKDKVLVLKCMVWWHLKHITEPPEIYFRLERCGFVSWLHCFPVAFTTSSAAWVSYFNLSPKFTLL